MRVAPDPGRDERGRGRGDDDPVDGDVLGPRLVRRLASVVDGDAGDRRDHRDIAYGAVGGKGRVVVADAARVANDIGRIVEGVDVARVGDTVVVRLGGVGLLGADVGAGGAVASIGARSGIRARGIVPAQEVVLVVGEGDGGGAVAVAVARAVGGK